MNLQDHFIKGFIKAAYTAGMHANPMKGATQLRPSMPPVNTPAPASAPMPTMAPPPAASMPAPKPMPTIMPPKPPTPASAQISAQVHANSQPPQMMPHMDGDMVNTNHPSNPTNDASVKMTPVQQPTPQAYSGGGQWTGPQPNRQVDPVQAMHHAFNLPKDLSGYNMQGSPEQGASLSPGLEPGLTQGSSVPSQTTRDANLRHNVALHPELLSSLPHDLRNRLVSQDPATRWAAEDELNTALNSQYASAGGDEGQSDARNLFSKFYGDNPAPQSHYIGQTF